MLTLIGVLALQLGGTEPGPLPIVAGDDVAACGWPSVVAIMRTDPDTGTALRCSGTLIHPEIVLTAAHCIDPELELVNVSFGETIPPVGPADREVAIVECIVTPEAEPVGSVNTIRNDVAFCHLAESVTDVPIIPLISECELEAVSRGAAVTIVGFGATSRIQVGNTFVTEGRGIKRQATQTIEFVDTQTWHNVNMFNLQGPASCSGDSGGPAFVRLEDGSWRVFGTGSSGYTPEGATPPEPADNTCWAGSIYGHAGLYIEWLQSATDRELACHTGEAWNPASPCGALQTDPATGGGSWAAGCDAGPLVDDPQTCEVGGSSSSSGDGSTSLGDDTTSAATSSGDTSDTTTSTTTTGAETGSGGTSDQNDDTPDGCTCRGGTAPTPFVASVMLLLLGASRRRASAPRDAIPTHAGRRSCP